MERRAALKKGDNVYRMATKQRVAIKAANTDTERHNLVRVYEGEISAASFLTEINLPPLRQIGPVYVTAKDIICEINSDKVAVGVYHD